ncbi:hypothetical protein V8F20_009062 [Naviculisporaceae sp. PSN 640]
MEYLDQWTHMIPKQCETCKKTEGLLRCAGCSTYFYCSREHQVQDRPTHKSTCNQIKQAKEKADDFEAKLRADGVDFDSPEPESFWNATRQRMYLKARFLHGEMLIRSWRQQGIEDAAKLYMDILKLDRGDHQGCRQLIPGLLIRLNRDQECYDFLKWWAATDDKYLIDPNYPFLDIKDADATDVEDVKKLWCKAENRSFGNLFHLAALLLLMARLHWGFNELNNVHDEHPGLSNEEILAKVKLEYPGDILDRRTDLLTDTEKASKAWGDVEGSMKKIMNKINDVNEHYLPMILYPGPAEFNAGPTPYTFGSEEEARLAFSYTFNAWMESREAMKILHDEMVIDLVSRPTTELKVARKRWRGPSPREILLGKPEKK